MKNKKGIFFFVNLLLIIIAASITIFSIYYFSDLNTQTVSEIKSDTNNRNEIKLRKFDNRLPKTNLNNDYTEKKMLSKKKVDPNLEYAIKLLESDLNNKLKKNFIKPFNYTDGSQCRTKIILSKNEFDFIECNSDEIFKRELSLAINKILPIQRYTYNNINLSKEKDVIVILNMD